MVFCSEQSKEGWCYINKCQWLAVQEHYPCTVPVYSDRLDQKDGDLFEGGRSTEGKIYGIPCSWCRYVCCIISVD